MFDVFNIVFLVAAVLSALAGILFISRSFNARSASRRQRYNVGQTETMRMSRINILRALFFFFVALVFAGLFAARPLFFSGSAAEPAAAAATPVAATTAPTTATSAAPIFVPTVPPEPTAPLASPTPLPTAVPTATPAPVMAIVSSGVGVWLRSAPSTTSQQLEWLLDGTEVLLMPLEQAADDLVWQQVRTGDGLVGWVARDFLVIQEPGAAPTAETGVEETAEPTAEATVAPTTTDG